MKKIARLLLCALCVIPAKAQDSGSRFELEAKVVAIPEDVWKKLCKQNPAFTDYSASFPDLAQPKPVYADLGKKIVEAKKGEWEIPTGTIREFPALSATEYTSLLTTLQQTQGVESLNPPVTGSIGKIIAETGREFRFPTEFQDNKDAPPKETKNEAGQTVMAKPARFTPTAFVTKNTGFSLEASPTKGKDGAVDLDLAVSFFELCRLLHRRSPRQQNLRSQAQGIAGEHVAARIYRHARQDDGLGKTGRSHHAGRHPHQLQHHSPEGGAHVRIRLAGARAPCAADIHHVQDCALGQLLSHNYT